MNYYNDKTSERLIVYFNFDDITAELIIPSKVLIGIESPNKVSMEYSNLAREEINFGPKWKRVKAINHLVSSINDYWMYLNQKK